MNIPYLFCFYLFSTLPSCYTTFNGDDYHQLKTFNEWRVKYNKTYGDERNISQYFENWKKNRILVDYHNHMNADHFSVELNEFSDISWKDWTSRSGQNVRLSNSEKVDVPVEDFSIDVTKLPKSVDWRKKGVVTPIKNQQQCGSCWAFSAVGSMEGQHALKTGNLVSLSESQIVDCDVNGTDEGCNGGFMDGAFKYVISQGGIDEEQSYPYVPMDQKCKFNQSNIAATFSSFQDVKGGERGLMEAVATKGPISVAIDASGSKFQFYKNGIYYDETCSQTMLDHGVLVVGYGSNENGSNFWIVKNSWGTGWGLDGYIYMSKDRGNNCGIATTPSYPVV